MIANKITKEEQEAKIQLSASKALSKMRKKPGFLEWATNDPKAFNIIYMMGAFGGVFVTLLMLGVSLYFDFDIFFKVLFGAILAFQSWNTYKVVKNRKYLNMTVNEMVYKKNNPLYDQKKSLYDKTKEDLNGVAA